MMAGILCFLRSSCGLAPCLISLIVDGAGPPHPPTRLKRLRGCLLQPLPPRQFTTERVVLPLDRRLACLRGHVHDVRKPRDGCMVEHLNARARRALAMPRQLDERPPRWRGCLPGRASRAALLAAFPPQVAGCPRSGACARCRLCVSGQQQGKGGGRHRVRRGGPHPPKGIYPLGAQRPARAVAVKTRRAPQVVTTLALFITVTSAPTRARCSCGL